MTVINALLDNLGGVFNPKGNLADWRHAARTFIDNGFRLAPKAKFLYHTSFNLTPAALGMFPKYDKVGRLETGLLVKSADLPKYTPTVETLKQYNKSKLITTGITYEPVNITFHDDNLGITNELMEMYYRFHYADGHYVDNKNAYGLPAGPYKQVQGDHYAYGYLGNSYRFFDSITISQLTRGDYTTFQLVNPILSSFGHSDLDYSDPSGTTTNSITVNYEAVWYTRGTVTVGPDGDPKGYGAMGYDNVPSPISLLGGGAIGVLGLGSAVGDLFGNADKRNPLATAIGAVNLIGNVQNLNAKDAFEQVSGGVISNLEQGGGIGGIAGAVIPGL